MSLLDTLLEMGFPRDRAEKALSSTGGTNLEAAINWIVSNADETGGSGAQFGGEPNEASTVEITMNDPPSVDVELEHSKEAKSIKCEDCGKLFKSEDEVQFHAVKSGHANFSESTDEVKPLTEEEKRSRMQALQDRLKQKRTEKEEKDKKEAVEVEKQRRNTGQQMAAAKQRIEEEEMKKIAEDKKRQKKEDALEKKRILEQIKSDREAKKQGGSNQQAAASASIPVQAAPISSSADTKKVYEQCQLQVRLLNGTVLKQTFGAKEPLSAVRLFVQLQLNNLDEPFTFMTNFPKRVFGDVDMDTPLLELGLVPSSVLIMVRKQQ